MSDQDQSNNPNDVLRDTAFMAKQIAELQAQLAKLSPSVANPKFAADSALPRYKLNSPCYFDDTIFDAGIIITYTDVPNLEMVPVNEAATVRMREYLEMLENGARAKAEQAGRGYGGLVTDRGVMIAQAQADAVEESRRVTIAMPVERGPVPQMGHTDEAIRRKRGRPKKVVNVEIPQSDVNEPTPAIIGHALEKRGVR